MSCARRQGQRLNACISYYVTGVGRGLPFWGSPVPLGVASGACPEFSPCRRTKQGPSVSPSCSSWVFTRCYYVPDSCFTAHEFKRVRGTQERTAPVETVCRRRLRIRAGQYILLTASQRAGRNLTLTNDSQEKSQQN